MFMPAFTRLQAQGGPLLLFAAALGELSFAAGCGAPAVGPQARGGIAERVLALPERLPARARPPCRARQGRRPAHARCCCFAMLLSHSPCMLRSSKCYEANDSAQDTHVLCSLLWHWESCGIGGVMHSGSGSHISTHVQKRGCHNGAMQCNTPQWPSDGVALRACRRGRGVGRAARVPRGARGDGACGGACCRRTCTMGCWNAPGPPSPRMPPPPPDLDSLIRARARASLH